MKLVNTQTRVTTSVVGIQAAVLRDDVNGSILVIQEGTEQLRIKLSDLVNFIIEQEKPVVNPEPSGSKGDSETE